MKPAGHLTFSVKTLEPPGGREAFRRIKTKGKVFEGKFLKFYYVSSGDQPAPFSVAVSVSKRHGSAVRRNRIKRRIRESIRLSVREFHEELKTRRPSFSVVVVYKGMKADLHDSTEFADFRRDTSGFIDAVHSSNAGN